MEKQIQLDKVRIRNELNAIKSNYSLYAKVKKVTTVFAYFTPLWALIDYIRYCLNRNNIILFVPWLFLTGICSFIVQFIIIRVTISFQKKYEMTFKKRMAEPILNASFEKVNYAPERGFSKSEVKAMNLLYLPFDEHFESEDMIEAEHMGVAFKQSDILFSEYRTHDSDDRRVYPQDYEGREISVDGRLIRFPYKIEINGIIQIGMRKGLRWKHYYGKKRIELEDIEFNKYFDVFADDEYSTFYALTPQMMDYFNSLRVVSKEQIVATMDGEYLYLLRYGKGGVFKADIKEPFDVDYKEQQIYKEIEEIETLIKVFHLQKWAGQA